MPIVESEINVYRSTTTDPTGTTDGGRFDRTKPITSGALAGLIADINDAERTAGNERHYKMSFVNEDTENLTFKNAYMFLAFSLLNDVVVSLINGTPTSTWGDVSANAKMGCGTLATALTAGDQTIVVDTRGAAYDHFNNGDVIAITDSENLTTDLNGKLEYVTIDQEPSYAGNQVTLHVSTPIVNSYALTRTGPTIDPLTTRVASVISYGDVKASLTVGTKVSTAGTYDDAVVGLVVPNATAIEQVITLTFDSSSTFTAASNVPGVTLPSGGTGSTYTSDYIVIPTGFWTGTWANGDTLQVTTHAGEMPVHLHVDIPAGAAATAVESFQIWASGATGSS